MKLIKIKDLNYSVIFKNKNIGNIGIKNNELKFNIPTMILIKIFPKFLNLIKKTTDIKYIYYKGDNDYLKSKYLKSDRGVIIKLYPYTYMIKSYTLDENDYNKYFINRGNWIKYETEKDGNFSEFILLQGDEQLYKHKEYYLIKSIIINTVVKKSINVLRKSNFHKVLMPALNKLFIPDRKTFNLTRTFNPNKYKNFINNHNILILRADQGYKGTQIRIIKKYEDFKNIIKELKIIKNNDNWDKAQHIGNHFFNNIRWTLESYISKPLLYKNKKFHFRTYVIFSTINKNFIFKKFPIGIAKEDYKNDDYDNMNIHQSHLYDSEELIYLDDFIDKKNLTYIINQLIILFTDFSISKTLSYKCYDETTNCYKIFGADLLIEEDYSIKFIAFNSKPSFDLLYKDIYTKILENTMYYIVDEILPPKNKIKDPKMFVPLI